MSDTIVWVLNPSVRTEFEQALAEHREWLHRWHGALLCGPAPDDETIAEDAALRCRLGLWLSRWRDEALLDDGLFAALDTAHAGLHALARSLALEVRAGGRVDRAAYSELVQVAETFERSARGILLAFERALSDLDPLTGLQNRRTMLAELDRERSRGKRGGTHSVIAIADLDHFKEVNDAHGHAVGDRVLQTAAQIFQSLLRPYDSVFRYGGEEFLFCLPDTELQAAVVILERLRTALAACRIPVSSGAVTITASFGVAPMEPGASVDESIERADRALYAAKRTGRNRVITWRGPIPIAVGAVA